MLHRAEGNRRVRLESLSSLITSNTFHTELELGSSRLHVWRHGSITLGTGVMFSKPRCRENIERKKQDMVISFTPVIL